MTIPRIVLMIVYFGQLPVWLPAFLLSCRYNPDVDWLIFADSETPPNCPENVKFLKTDLVSFNQLASDKLGFRVNITPSYLYKLVDMKPAFGKIFEDSLQECGFWGHCDMDVVWGQIRTFVDANILEHFDLITSRIGKISGHFCLYRNVPEMNTIFLKIPDMVTMVQQNEKRCGITEPCLTAYLRNQIKPDLLTRIKRLLPGKHPVGPRVYWDQTLTTCGKHQRKVGETQDQGLRWIRGRTFDLHGEEMMYLHFHKIKQFIQHINFGYWDDPTEFVITKSKIMIV
jgi:hypothetical protein